jgi:hypothetical protein
LSGQQEIALSYRGFSGLNELFESGFVIDGDFGKHFAVQGDIGFNQPVDETAVTDFISPAGRVDTHSPEAAEVALFLLAMDKGHCLSAIHCFGGLAEKLAAGAVETFGKVQAVLSATV